jgi:hypothetical protein
VDWDGAREAINRREELLEGNDADAINAFEELASPASGRVRIRSGV